MGHPVLRKEQIQALLPGRGQDRVLGGNDELRSIHGEFLGDYPE
jgi:hypothetical protein